VASRHNRDLEYARRVIAAYEDGLGRASAVGLDGQMIDLPVVLRVQRLSSAQEIEAFETRKAAAVAAAGGRI
jgi:citrate lyase beta subunit